MNANNMEIKKFNINSDFRKLEDYLRNEYFEHKNITSWLPQRLEDLIYRIDIMHAERGKLKSIDYIYLFMNEQEIVGCILPDGAAIYTSLKKGYEYLYEEMVSYAQENCRPLFEKDENGQIDFLVIEHDSFRYRQEILKKLGYKREKEEDYDNYVYPQQMEVEVNLPSGFKLCYGDDYKDEAKKRAALHFAFHPEDDIQGYKDNRNDCNSRKQAPMYKDCFECLVIDQYTNEENNVASYCFVYVDKEAKTAFIEPVGTRGKYQHKGIGIAMMHGVILKCKELGIEKCYVNSYDWRKKFYNAAGFITEDILGYWKKKI